MSMWELLRSRFPDDLSAIAVESPGGAVLAYGDLEVQTARLGSVLREMGATRGRRVMIAADKSHELLSLYLACLRIGAVVVPLNPGFPVPELEYFIADSKPSVIVCRADVVDALRGSTGTGCVVKMSDFAEVDFGPSAFDKAGEAKTAPSSQDDPAAILYTSGTTGRSKGAVLSNRNLAANAVALSRCWGFDPSTPDVLLHALPLFHVHGLFVACHCALLSGSKMIFLPKFSVDSVLDALERSTVMMGVPTFYARLLRDERLTAELCAGVRLFISGSAPLSLETFRQFSERTGRIILERYGMTESLITTSNPLEGERLAGAVGFPLPGVEARIADEAGVVLRPPTMVGELEVRGEQVFNGYLERPEATARSFRQDGFFRTGDLARIDERGYIWLAGRATELIITGGENVYPKEVENALDEIEGVDESAVFGVPDEDFGERVSAAVVLASDAGDVTQEGLKLELKKRLAGHKVPKAIHFVSALPRNAMGKVQKSTLLKRFP